MAGRRQRLLAAVAGGADAVLSARPAFDLTRQPDCCCPRRPRPSIRLTVVRLTPAARDLFLRPGQGSHAALRAAGHACATSFDGARKALTQSR
jgi:hypothetical protein